MYAQIEKPKENKSRAVANSVVQGKSNGRQGFRFVDNRSIAKVRKGRDATYRHDENSLIVQSIKHQPMPTSLVTQMVPKGRNEYTIVEKYFTENRNKIYAKKDYPELSAQARNLLYALGEYPKLTELDNDDTNVKKIKSLLEDEEVQKELKNACIEIDQESGAARWKIMLQRLRSGTEDELMEYGGVKEQIWRFGSRINKWGKPTTVGIQAGMQYLMFNPISSAAFGGRAILQQLNLHITNALSLETIMKHPLAYQRITTGIS
ncbi:hypothetical protein [Shewanella surugensis]|uniref:Uncharacterized protein n=1 Tax=Shewanella surugensis TaxID=212020 RepID=A0ABT0LJQ0_9GAMM|nr:hypothetical protein [Shewanella surugensis]MCL1127942.1 hypothetical protein [Shewanella surugensis]